MYTLFRVYSTWVYKSNNLKLKLGKHVNYYHFFKLYTI